MSKKLKTNLDEVMSGIGRTLGSPGSLPNSVKSSKFKPKIANASTSALPSFRTAGFGLKTQDTQEVIVVPDSPSTSSSSLKRSSSDIYVITEPSPPPLKRSKREDPVFSNKENLVRGATSVKGKERLVPMDIDEEHQFRRTPLAENSSRPSPAPHNPPRLEVRPSSALEHSTEDIKNWLTHCKLLRIEICEQLLAYHEGDKTKDATVLKSLRQVLDDRTVELQKLLSPPSTTRAHVDTPIAPVQNPPWVSAEEPPVDMTGDDGGDEDLWGNFEEPDITMVEPQPVNEWEPLKVQTTQSSVTLPSIPSSPPDRQVANSPHVRQLMDVLNGTFNLERFRTNQLEAVVASMEGKDVFVLMPTGGGKSLCYQLPAVCVSQSKGQVTFVITPLLALMDDQVRQLQKRFGVNAIAWTAESNVNEHLLMSGEVPIVYVTPEKLSASGYTKSTIQRLYQNRMVARFVVDEAHCISSWGQDFREAYANLGELRKSYPDVPIMALTATANSTTINDIIHQLKLKDPIRLVQSFNRANLSYTIREKKGKANQPIVEDLQNRYRGQCGVIYCRAKKTCEDLAAELMRSGVSATHYHAGMAADERQRAAGDWQTGKVHVVVATIAFGMGIDKADVRFVIHRDMPKNMSGYYQETGRAGRDGQPADCIMYYNFADFRSVRKMIQEAENATEDSKARQIDGLKEMYNYCCNTSKYRRVQVLGHFGEKFEEKDCNKTCDVCQDTRELVKTDATGAARVVLKLMKAATRRRILVAQGHLASAVRGMGGQAIKTRFGELEGFGEAKTQDGDFIELLIKELLGQDVLDLQDRQNQGGGYHTAYIELGSTAAAFERELGRKPYMIAWRPKSKVKGATRTVSTTNAPAAPTKRKGKATEIQDDPIEDDIYCMTDEEGASFIPAPAPPRRTRTNNATPGPSSISAPPAPAPAMSRAASRTNAPPTTTIPTSVVIPVTPQDVGAALSPEQFHDKLRDVRRMCMQKHRLSDESHILEDHVLEMLTLMIPTDYSRFKDVVADAMRDGYEPSDTAASDAREYADAKWKLCGQEFLNACIEQKTRSGGPSNTNTTRTFPAAGTYEFRPPAVAARTNSAHNPTLVTTPLPTFVAPPPMSVAPRVNAGGKKFKPR